MSYVNRFVLVDGLTTHLDLVVAGIADPFLRNRYVGFFTVAAVTVFELAVKEILVDFATRKHKVFGSFCGDLYERLNGRISVKDLQDTYVKRFGAIYVKRFSRNLDALEAQVLKARGVSVKSSYGNVITWRHHFAHRGDLPANATYDEAKRGYELGKELLSALSASMVR